MFCTECGTAVEAIWKHCPTCGKSATQGNQNKPTTTTKSASQYTDGDLPEPSYSHWLAAGKPDFIVLNGEIIGFDLPLGKPEAEFYRFAFWLLKDVDAYMDWCESGPRLLHRNFDFTGFDMPDDAVLLTYTEIHNLLNEAEIDVWNQIGKPRLFQMPDGQWVFEQKIDAYNWRQIVNPIPDDVLELDTKAKIAKAKKVLAGNLPPRKKKDKVVYLNSDAEVKQYADRDSFKLWKKRGRPSVVVVNGEVMYEAQYRFLQITGFVMTGDLLEVWFWSGCPNLEYWNYELATQSYYETYQAAIGALQSTSQGVSGIFGAISSGLTQIGDQLASNASNTKSQMCMRCGRQVAFGSASPRGCAFCLMQN
jgi:hypothetical protein